MGFRDGTGPVPVFLDELLPRRLHLQSLEGRGLLGAPAFRRPDHRPEHQLQNRLPAPGVGDGPYAPAFHNEQPFQKFGGPDHTPVVHWHPEKGNAGLEFVEEAGDRTGK